MILYVVYMDFGNDTYVFGKYEDRDKANCIAMQLRDSRDCDTFVIAEEQN